VSSVIHLGRLSIAGTGIVTGGLVLGAALAAFANPLPKAPEPAPWEGTLHPQIAAGDAQPYYQSLPEDLYPANLPQGFAPAVASSEIKWPAQFAPRFAEPAPLPMLDDRPLADTPADHGPIVDRDVAIPHYAAIERSAQPAQPAQVASAEQPDDNQPVASADADPSALTVKIDPASPPPLPAGQARMIHISG
jgi:hypothetical protein